MDREQLWSRFQALSKGVKKGTKKKGNPEYERVGRSYRKRQSMGSHHQPPGGASGFSPRHNLGAVTHHAALGDRAMAETLDNFHEGHLRQILRNVDPHHPADGDHHELRARVRDLASGEATPAEPGPGRRRRKKAPATDAAPAEFSRSMGAKARRDD